MLRRILDIVSVFYAITWFMFTFTGRWSTRSAIVTGIAVVVLLGFAWFREFIYKPWRATGFTIVLALAVTTAYVSIQMLEFQGWIGKLTAGASAFVIVVLLLWLSLRPITRTRDRRRGTYLHYDRSYTRSLLGIPASHRR